MGTRRRTADLPPAEFRLRLVPEPKTPSECKCGYKANTCETRWRFCREWKVGPAPHPDWNADMCKDCVETHVDGRSYGRSGKHHHHKDERAKVLAKLAERLAKDGFRSVADDARTCEMVWVRDGWG